MQVLGGSGNGCHTGHACRSVLGTPVRAYRHASFQTTSRWQVSTLLRAREALIHCWVTHMVGGRVVQLTVSRCVGSSEMGTPVRAYGAVCGVLVPVVPVVLCVVGVVVGVVGKGKWFMVTAMTMRADV